MWGQPPSSAVAVRGFSPPFRFQTLKEGSHYLTRTGPRAIKRARQALTRIPPLPRLIAMEIPLTPDLQAKLSRLAVQQGRPTEVLVVEAVERMVNYDEWFLREVQKGLAAADRGELIDHDEVKKLTDERYPG
jgi:predicted transcriptional regulator